jgi:hypothetical protein
MRATLGPAWRDCFDLIICNCRKPLFHRGESPFFEVDLERTGLKLPRGIHTAPDLWDRSLPQDNKIFLQGNAKVLTEYLQFLTGKTQMRVAFFGDHYQHDLHAVSEFNHKLQRLGSGASWSAIAIIPEMSAYDSSFHPGFDAHLIPHDAKLWGESYFYDVSPQRTSLNLFVSSIEKICRYAVPFG